MPSIRLRPTDGHHVDACSRRTQPNTSDSDPRAARRRAARHCGFLGRIRRQYLLVAALAVQAWVPAGLNAQGAGPAARATIAHTLSTATASNGFATTGTIAAVPAATLPEGIPDFSADTTRPSVQSVQTGRWSDAATWQGGQVPTSNHIVRVAAGHVVTIDDTTA